MVRYQDVLQNSTGAVSLPPPSFLFCCPPSVLTCLTTERGKEGTFRHMGLPFVYYQQDMGGALAQTTPAWLSNWLWFIHPKCDWLWFLRGWGIGLKLVRDS